MKWKKQILKLICTKCNLKKEESIEFYSEEGKGCEIFGLCSKCFQLDKKK